MKPLVSGQLLKMKPLQSRRSAKYFNHKRANCGNCIICAIMVIDIMNSSPNTESITPYPKLESPTWLSNGPKKFSRS